MIDLDKWSDIRRMDAAGATQREIAAQLEASRNTVAAAIRAERPQRYERRPSPSPLEPFQELLEAAVRSRLRGSRVLLELRQRGFEGSRATFYSHWSAFKAAYKEPAAARRFETDPGEQAQFDWSEYALQLGQQTPRVYIYSLVMGYSRSIHWFPSLAADQEAALEALEAGFHHFGGVPREVVIDNPKVFVVRRAGQEIEWNRVFQSFAGYYRFRPIACRPRNPQAKGKVENPFQHLEELFLRGRCWRDWACFEQELAAFEAGWERRIHGTTKKVPAERFEEERSRLISLPVRRFLSWHVEFRHVRNDCLISYGNVLYSVPSCYAGKKVVVRRTQGRELLVEGQDGKEAARHEIRPKGSPPVILTEHYQALRRRHERTLAGLAQLFRQRYGEAAIAETFLQRLIAQHRHRPEQALGHAMDLLSGVPVAMAHGAMARAVEFNVCTPHFLKDCLRRQCGEQPAKSEPFAGGPAVQLALPCLDVERPLSEYDRALD